MADIKKGDTAAVSVAETCNCPLCGERGRHTPYRAKYAKEATLHIVCASRDCLLATYPLDPSIWLALACKTRRIDEDKPMSTMAELEKASDDGFRNP